MDDNYVLKLKLLIHAKPSIMGPVPWLFAIKPGIHMVEGTKSCKLSSDPHVHSIKLLPHTNEETESKHYKTMPTRILFIL